MNVDANFTEPLNVSADFIEPLNVSADFVGDLAANVAAIPYVESSNTYGTTVTIG